MGLERLAPWETVVFGGLLAETFPSLLLAPLIFIWATKDRAK